MTGCKVFSNGVGMELSGTNFAVTGNVFSGNKQAAVLHDKTGAAVTGNVGCC